MAAYSLENGPEQRLDAPAEYPSIAILASGSGSTAAYVIHATQTRVLRARVERVISNNRSAGVFQRVQRLNQQYGLSIATEHISGLTHPGRPPGKGEMTDAESEAVADVCKEFDLVLLLGYMKRVRGPLLDQRVINTHPGPLPATAGCIGSDAQQRVLDLGLTHSAQTLHWVDGSYDTGAVIAAHEVPVWPGDDAESLFAAVQETEKTWVPRDLDTLLHGPSF